MSVTILQAKHAYRYDSELPSLLISKSDQGYTLCINHSIVATARGKIKHYKTIEAITNDVRRMLNRDSFVFMYSFKNI